jgi:predicted Rossmann fold flavoprotein
MNHYDVIIVGGGAAGFFAAINVAEQNPKLKVAIFERGKSGLQKVKISGGGRCNVTHAEFIPSELVRNYPRGEKELLGPFHQFMTGDTIQWFEDRGVALKIEDDGRMFPVTNSSQTIIDCFLNEAQKHKVDILYNHALKSVIHSGKDWLLETSQGEFSATKLMLATGSNPKIWKLLEQLGHTISKAVPSLFTFDIKDERIKDIPGVVALDVEVKVVGSNLWSEGPLLITHVGMSAPAILKLSAFGAIELAKCDYDFEIEVNFIKQSLDDCMEQLKTLKHDLAKKTVLEKI